MYQQMYQWIKENNGIQKYEPMPVQVRAERPKGFRTTTSDAIKLVREVCDDVINLVRHWLERSD
jgi:hypothetical protein